jgi:hypothetical protein
VVVPAEDAVIRRESDARLAQGVPVAEDAAVGRVVPSHRVFNLRVQPWGSGRLPMMTPLEIGLLVGGVIALGVLGILLRRPLLRVVRIAKAIAFDKRLPRYIRWPVRLALAMKVVPFPDFGIDELILAVVTVLLVTVHRETLQAILAETRDSALDVTTTSRTDPLASEQPAIGG